MRRRCRRRSRGNERAALDAGVIVFEAMQEAQLFPEHNEMSFYAWGDANCCLRTGATEATLRGTFDNLKIGDVLIFQEMVGPQTGEQGGCRRASSVRGAAHAGDDARRGRQTPRRSPVREKARDGRYTICGATAETGDRDQWSADDALPFPVCISSKFLDSTQKEQSLVDVSKVFGNVVLADHGVTLADIDLGIVPRAGLFCPPGLAADRCHPVPPVPIPVRYRPAVPDSPITQAVALQVAGSPVTPDPVALAAAGYVSLVDAEAASRSRSARATRRRGRGCSAS